MINPPKKKLNNANPNPVHKFKTAPDSQHFSAEPTGEYNYNNNYQDYFEWERANQHINVHYTYTYTYEPEYFDGVKDYDYSNKYRDFFEHQQRASNSKRSFRAPDNAAHSSAASYQREFKKETKDASAEGSAHSHLRHNYGN